MRENLFMISLSLFFFFFSVPFPVQSLVNVCKVSAVNFRVRPSISSKYTPFKQTQEAVHRHRKMKCIMKKGERMGTAPQLTSTLTSTEGK